MIDTHAHIRPEDEIKIKGLEWVVLSASNIEDSKENIILAKSNKKLLPAIGIHPQEKILVTSNWIQELEELLINNKEIVAVGECGLDFSDEYDKKQQQIFFRGQICLALKYKKPLIIHSRKAMDETIEILKSYQNLSGVIHCYTGGAKRIPKIQELGENWFMGIDGNLTYEEGLMEVVKKIPKDRLVLETDSPFLTPVPHRGETNYPEYVKFIYQKVADIWGMSFSETEKIIDENARKLFNVN